MKTKLSFYLFLALGAFAFGQVARPPMTSTPVPVGGPTRPGSVDDSGIYGFWTEMSDQARAGGYLLGKLVVEGEPLLWEPIPVTVTCNDKPINAALTDPKGNFAIHPAPSPGASEATADPKRQLETRYEGCKVQAVLAGFGSNTIILTPHNLRDDPNLGTITLYREEERSKGTAMSTTGGSAPAEAMKSFEKARTELLEQKPDRARRDLQKAVELYPGFAEAWYQLGKLQQEADPQSARSSYSKALAADPQFILPHVQLAAMNVQDGKWHEVLGDIDHALQLYPTGTTKIWYYNALANFQLGKADAAEASALKSLTMDPDHSIPNTEQLLAVMLARKGDYAGALKHLRNTLTYVPSGPTADLLKQQIALLEQRARPPK